MNTNPTAPIDTKHLKYRLIWADEYTSEREYEVSLYGRIHGHVGCDEILVDPEDDEAGWVKRWNFKRFDGKFGCGSSRPAAILQSYENDVPA